MVGISEDIKDITEEIDHVLLEELICDFRRSSSKVVDQVERDYSSAPRINGSETYWKDRDRRYLA
jgi:hypothetical protein